MRSRGRNLPLRTAMARRRYVETTNVVCYGPYGRANLADIWRRRDLPRDAKAPVLVQVPGGAWVLGWRRPQAYPLMSHLAARGWVCVSLNYRVSPRHTWPDHIVDVKRALAWVKEKHQRLRRGSEFRCHQRRFGRRPSVRPGGVDPQRSAISARVRTGRHLGGGSGSGIRALRLVYDRCAGASGIRRVARNVRGETEIQHAPRHLRRCLTDPPCAGRRPTVLRSARPPRLPDPRGRSPCVRRGTAGGVEVARRLRGPAPRPTRLRRLRPPRAHHTAEAVARFLSWVYATNPPAT